MTTSIRYAIIPESITDRIDHIRSLDMFLPYRKSAVLAKHATFFPPYRLFSNRAEQV